MIARPLLDRLEAARGVDLVGTGGDGDVRGWTWVDCRQMVCKRSGVRISLAPLRYCFRRSESLRQALLIVETQTGCCSIPDYDPS